MIPLLAQAQDFVPPAGELALLRWGLGLALGGIVAVWLLHRGERKEWAAERDELHGKYEAERNRYRDMTVECFEKLGTITQECIRVMEQNKATQDANTAQGARLEAKLGELESTVREEARRATAQLERRL